MFYTNADSSSCPVRQLAPSSPMYDRQTDRQADRQQAGSRQAGRQGRQAGRQTDMFYVLDSQNVGLIQPQNVKQCYVLRNPHLRFRFYAVEIIITFCVNLSRFALRFYVLGNVAFCGPIGLYRDVWIAAIA